jgi:2-polyprenyl-6-methoxyphenol hydroxylase-like FAD-dependent oxidoreductase
MSAWATIYNALRDLVPAHEYHSGKQLVSIEQANNRVTAVFSDGCRETGDLLVGADGLRSTVRQQFAPEIEPIYAGYVAWRGMVEESVLSARALKEMFPYFAFGLPEHEQMIAYPVAGKNNTVEPGKRRYNFVWYRPADEATTLRDMVTDATGKIWLDGIPPPLIQAHHLAHARAAARQVLAPQFAEMIEKTEHLFFQPVFDLESNQLAFGRIALLGDAAFVGRPHVGMGVTKAGDEAIAIARHIAKFGPTSAALEAYSQERLSLGQQVVARAQYLGRYMQAQGGKGTGDGSSLRRNADTVMAETAIDISILLAEGKAVPELN